MTVIVVKVVRLEQWCLSSLNLLSSKGQVSIAWDQARSWGKGADNRNNGAESAKKEAS